MITDAFGTATELALKAKLEGIGQGIAGTVLVILGLWVAIRIVHAEVRGRIPAPLVTAHCSGRSSYHRLLL